VTVDGLGSPHVVHEVVRRLEGRVAADSPSHDGQSSAPEGVLRSRKRVSFLDLKGKIKFAPGYDYKKLRIGK
jgi:hypothetical protein